MKYLEAKRLAARLAREAQEKDEPEAEAKMDTRELSNKAVLEGPANKDEWMMRMSPAQYIALNADSENPAVQAKVALARRILEADG
jgi:hypothetical protein